MEYELRSRGYTHTIALVGGHLAAVGSAYNWQGTRRIGEIMGRSQRTVQRARAVLEGDGLIRSELLLTGDVIEGQRRPVKHPQVIRDVSELQRLVGGRGGPLRQPAPARRDPARRSPGSRRPSVADVPRATADELADIAATVRERDPELAALMGQIAGATAAREQQAPRQEPAPVGCPPTIEPSEIDEWDRVTAELERECDRRERDPPSERGPPSH